MQLVGTKKSQLTRKVQRFAQERQIAIQFRDLDKDDLREGELKNLAQALGGWEVLLDKTSAEWKKLGFEYRDFDAEEELKEHPKLLRIPILREGPKAWIIDEQSDLKTLFHKA